MCVVTFKSSCLQSFAYTEIIQAGYRSCFIIKIQKVTQLINKNIGLLNQLFNPTLVKRSLATALIVGAVLNVINQYDGVFGQAPILWGSMLLTFIVPYFVSSVSGMLTLRQFAKQQATKSSTSE